ncbi:hypothetical protein K474DRAFT_1680768, partial [Panus rudis PR-1116 ss-1]
MPDNEPASNADEETKDEADDYGGELATGTAKDDLPDEPQIDLRPSIAGPPRNEATCEATRHKSGSSLTIPMLSPSHVDTLTNEEVQMTKYLMELVSHGVRQYATGFLVEDQWISLWYGDRFGVIKSAFFDWIAEPHFLLLMVAALRFSDRRRLGFSPFVSMDPNAPAENPYINATLRLSTDVNYQEHAEDATSTNDFDNGTKGKGEEKRNGSNEGQSAKGSGKAKGKSKGEVEEGVLEEEVQE